MTGISWVMELVAFCTNHPQFIIEVDAAYPVNPELKDALLEPGLAFTIEPIVTIAPTQDYISLGKDDFSIVSPGNPSCQWEHIILITEDGCEVLTKRSEETHLP